MRFPQLNIGQQFEYQGKRYTKTGPLTASVEGTGASAMIRRSAEVVLVDGEVAVPSAAQLKQNYSRQEMLDLCRDYRLKLHHELKQMAVEEGGLELGTILRVIDNTFGNP
ncbi:MAG: hypothetical protein AB2806_14575 [Candidatus Thiodiazotropha sp.]